jgi:phosphoglycerol transferase MdoB-like AlkP superfamily enzyme
LARAPIASQVWRLRDAGYRTVCLHPFDRRFYRRDLVMPVLGFDIFLGRETLGGPRSPPYLSDPEFADHILRIVDEVGPQVFVFAITMGNHGPWLSQASVEPELAGLIDPDIPQRTELLRYLSGLHQSDVMLRLLIDGLQQRDGDPLLGFYGDHLPSLPRAFAHLGFDDWRSDYAIWSKSDEILQLGDLPAHELGRAVVDMALAPQHNPVFDAVVPEAHHA